jgi:hypothetical protein
MGGIPETWVTRLGLLRGEQKCPGGSVTTWMNGSSSSLGCWMGRRWPYCAANSESSARLARRSSRAGLEGLTDRSRRPYRHANQLPFQIETRIVRLGVFLSSSACRAVERCAGSETNTSKAFISVWAAKCASPLHRPTDPSRTHLLLSRQLQTEDASEPRGWGLTDMLKLSIYIKCATPIASGHGSAIARRCRTSWICVKTPEA